jgi:hypothetical protein
VTRPDVHATETCPRPCDTCCCWRTAFADGLVPFAGNPVEIAGRNRVWRQLLVDAIVNDPSWKGGGLEAGAGKEKRPGG